MRYLFATFTACLLAAPLGAQEGTGTITGTLDLDPAKWVVASRGDRPTSAVSSTENGTEIRIVGTPEPESDGGTGTLTMEIEAEAGAIEARATDVRIELQRGEDMLFAESENIDLTIEAYRQAGSDLAIAGSFVAVLSPEPQDSVMIASENGVTIDGNFQATIPVEDGG